VLGIPTRADMMLANRLHAFQQRSSKFLTRCEAFPFRKQDLRDATPADGQIWRVQINLVIQ
jgi:hypothetical protein